MGHTLEQAAPIIAAVVATAIGAPELDLGALGTAGLAAGAAGTTQAGIDYSQNHNLGPDLLNGAATGAASFAGSELGSGLGSALGSSTSSAGADAAANTITGAAGSTAGASTAAGGINASGGLGNFLNNSIGTNLGMTAGQSVPGNTFSNLVGDYAPGIGTALGNTGTGTALGSIAGGALGNQLTAPPPAAPTPWSADYTNPGSLPAGLTGGNGNPNLNGLSTNQQASYLASQGLFGGGNSTDEQQYFANLINNQLVNPGGNSQQGNPISSLQPVEQTYLQKLGFNTNNYGSPSSLLQAISQWQPS